MNTEESSFEALRRITRALDVYSRSLLRNHKLTGPQLAILKEVARHGQAPIGELGRATFQGAPTVTGVVDRLERQGLVARERGEHDRRQVLIRITASGKQLAQRSPPLLSSGFRNELLKLPKTEQKQICEVLNRVADMMELAESRTEFSKDK